VPAQELRLVHSAHELVGAGVLAAQGVSDGATLHGCLRLLAGGKGNKKGGKKYKKSAKQQGSRELVFKEDGQEYAQVVALLGGSRLRVQCADGQERLCTMLAAAKRRGWVGLRDIVLVGLREWENSKCDLIHKYSDDEARNLRAYKELPVNMVLGHEAEDNQFGTGDPDHPDVIFDLEDDSLDTVDIDDI